MLNETFSVIFKHRVSENQILTLTRPNKDGVTCVWWHVAAVVSNQFHVPLSYHKRVELDHDDNEEFQTIEVDDDSDESSSVDRASSNSPGLTNEETSYLKNLLALDIECRSRYPCHINQTAMQQQESKNVDLILDWNKTSLERLSYFAYKVHLFQR